MHYTVFMGVCVCARQLVFSKLTGSNNYLPIRDQYLQEFDPSLVT